MAAEEAARGDGGGESHRVQEKTGRPRGPEEKQGVQGPVQGEVGPGHGGSGDQARFRNFIEHLACASNVAQRSVEGGERARYVVVGDEVAGFGEEGVEG